jgi:hypothetical protein
VADAAPGDRRSGGCDGSRARTHAHGTLTQTQTRAPRTHTHAHTHDPIHYSRSGVCSAPRAPGLLRHAFKGCCGGGAAAAASASCGRDDGPCRCRCCCFCCCCPEHCIPWDRRRCGAPRRSIAGRTPRLFGCVRCGQRRRWWRGVGGGCGWGGASRGGAARAGERSAAGGSHEPSVGERDRRGARRRDRVRAAPHDEPGRATGGWCGGPRG